MEFSSSSDDELEAQLRHQLRRENRQLRGIVRNNNNAVNSVARVLKIPNGASVEVRRGTIFIPVRDRYISILEARARPERFFGESRVKVHLRRPLSPETVQLQQGFSELSRDGVPTVSWRDVALSEADPTAFYIFKRVADNCSRSPQPAEKSQRDDNKLFDPLAEARYGRMLNLPWCRSVHLAQRRWYIRSLQYWPTDDPLDATSLSHASTDKQGGGPAWFYDGPNKRLLCVAYAQKQDRLVTSSVVPLPSLPSQGSLGIECSYSEPNSAVAVLVGDRSIARVEWENCDWREVMPNATRTCVSAPFQFPFTCWCKPPTPEYGNTWVGLATERVIFEGRISTAGHWEMRKVLHIPRNKMVTAMYALTSSCGTPTTNAPPSGILCGMRNGTIQWVPLKAQATSTMRYDTTARHHGATICHLDMLPHSEYQLLSVASNAEAKVWDLRYFSSHKDPLLVVCSGARFGDAADKVRVSRCGSVLAIASKALGITCRDTSSNACLYESLEDIPYDTHPVLREYGMDYELLLLGTNANKRLVFERRS